MALFIEIQVDPAAAKNPETAAKLAEVCPVGIFATNDAGELDVVEANVDECTLCELCLAVGDPGQVQVIKLYDENKRLERSA